MKKKATKIISIILSVLLIFSVIPMTALATDSVASVTTSTGEVTDYTDLTEAFYAAAGSTDSTIKLLNDVDLNGGSIEISNYTGFTSGSFTIELNGKTISSKTDSSVLCIGPDINCIIKDSIGDGGIVNLGGVASTAILAMGDITIESGIFTSENEAITIYDGSTTINGGTFNSPHFAISVYGGFLTVNNGEFNGDSYGLYFTEETMFYKTQGKGIVYGGTFNGGIGINYADDNFRLINAIADGYGVFGEDGNEIVLTEMQRFVSGNVTVKESVSEREYVASLTNADGTVKEFISFDEAYNVALATKNSILTLYDDVEVAGKFTPSKYVRPDFTFDLNGFTVSGSSDSYIFGLTKNTKIVIKDSVGTGKIVNTHKSFGSVFANTGTLIIENGNIISTAKTAITSDNTLIVYGGSISGKEYGINSSGNITIYDGEISGEKFGLYVSVKNGSVGTLYGGTFNEGIDLYDSSSNYTIANLLAEGHFYYDNDDNNITDFGEFQAINETVIVKNKFPVSVIQPDGTTEYFPSVDEGLNSANRDIDSILKLLTDILLNSSLTFNGTTTLDLNGKTLDVNDENSILVGNGGLLNIADSLGNGTIDGGTVLVDGGTLNLNDGTIVSTTNGITNSGGTVNINGGEIISEVGYVDIFVEGDNTTKVYGGTYEDGFTTSGATVSEVLADGYVFYNGEGAVEITDNQKEISDNVVVYEKTIVTAMSSQIRFNRNDDGSYAGTFDVRTRAKISDADFNKYIAGSNENATEKISKVGFVYAQAKNGFDINIAKTVAQGGKVDGFIDAPVSYIQDADGYYMFTCLVTGIPEDELDNGLTAYAYICVDGTWYFFPVEVTAEFGEMYSTYYPLAAEQYGWEV